MLFRSVEELYKKDLHDPDNHGGVITDLEPDIPECEVKWALESITMPESQATLLSHRGLEKASKPTGWFLHPLTPSLSPYCAHCYKQALGGFTRKQNCPSLDLYGIHLPKERGTRSGQK